MIKVGLLIGVPFPKSLVFSPFGYATKQVLHGCKMLTTLAEVKTSIAKTVITWA
jgi:hypothetical protein